MLERIDAPLDDANVERLCSLLEELSDTNTTASWLVTLHRNDHGFGHRLYGVTMTERGGVQSCGRPTMQQAENLRETAWVTPLADRFPPSANTADFRVFRGSLPHWRRGAAIRL